MASAETITAWGALAGGFGALMTGAATLIQRRRRGWPYRDRRKSIRRSARAIGGRRRTDRRA